MGQAGLKHLPNRTYTLRALTRTRARAFRQVVTHATSDNNVWNTHTDSQSMRLDSALWDFFSFPVWTVKSFTRSSSQPQGKETFEPAAWRR